MVERYRKVVAGCRKVVVKCRKVVAGCREVVVRGREREREGATSVAQTILRAS